MVDVYDVKKHAFILNRQNHFLRHFLDIVLTKHVQHKKKTLLKIILTNRK